MSDDIVVRLPHSLGADGVKRRLQGALQEIQTSYGKILTLSQVEWTEDRVTFVASALGQTLRGAIDIAETYVELRASLPFLLRAFAKRIASAVQDNGGEAAPIAIALAGSSPRAILAQIPRRRAAGCG